MAYAMFLLILRCKSIKRIIFLKKNYCAVAKVATLTFTEGTASNF
jgi:hypothetical protein